MTARELEGRLKRASGKVRFFPGPNRGSGLYIQHRDPDDPEQARNLKFLCGIPSPRFNGSIPKYNFLDQDGKWARGLKSIVRVLAREKVDGKRLFPTKFLEKLCPGFQLGSAGLTPQDQSHIRAFHQGRADRQKRLRDLGGELSALKAGKGVQVAV